ncbi:phosphatidylinositol N-acetylglucosaminyltransferase subunit H isoform X2 [Anolis carolinensis]|uniref:phosphatidylinositol N-acetylglucosaminyltransferase subunit H isoform X2 n=1 Tax=Anolis carolinensis TaxID=28377 RepID=UPI002F2B262F
MLHSRLNRKNRNEAGGGGGELSSTRDSSFRRREGPPDRRAAGSYSKSRSRRHGGLCSLSLLPRRWEMAEEERSFLTVSGQSITLQRCQHSAACREFQVRCPRLQLRSLSAATCSVWLAAYGLFVLTQNSVVLSAAIFVTLIGLLVYLHFVKIDQESLLIVGSLGIQMTSSYASGKESTAFIEMSQIKDVVINEAIYMQKVIYYLCILLQDPVEPHVVSEVVPLFQRGIQVHSTRCFV